MALDLSTMRITYSDSLEERIAGIQAERDHYRQLYYEELQKRQFSDALYEVKQDTLTVSHKASIYATVRYLQAHEKERDERGYIKFDGWQAGELVGQSYGTMMSNLGKLSREMRMREGVEVETDIGNVPVFDRLVVRVPTTDRQKYPQGYYLETYIKERENTFEPESYKPQTPIEWGGKRKNAGRKKCGKCGTWMKPKDHIRTIQREHICQHCGGHDWDAEIRVSERVPTTPDLDPDTTTNNQVDFCSLCGKPSDVITETNEAYCEACWLTLHPELQEPTSETTNNQVDCCCPDKDVEPDEDPKIEAESNGQLDEVVPPSLHHQDGVCSPVLEVDTLSPPDALKALPIWCCHRGKVPYNVSKMVRHFQKAKVNDSRTWTTYKQALAIYQESQSWKVPFDGIGMMNNGDYVFIDLDHCIYEGYFSELAKSTIALIDSYTEFSTSGTGIHIIAKGTVPKAIKMAFLEVYPEKRFFVFTGEHLKGTPLCTEDRQQALDEVYEKYCSVQESSYAHNLKSSEEPILKSDTDLPISDEEILSKGKNDTKFMDLYHGLNIGSYYQKKDGTPDYSRADLALCQKIAYWGAGSDVSTIDSLFRQSGLMRPKWERDDYREQTVQRAIELWQQQGRRMPYRKLCNDGW